MKKILLSVFVIASFIFYAFYERQGGDTGQTGLNNMGSETVYQRPLSTPPAAPPIVVPPAAAPAESKTPSPAPSDALYKDGAYTGPTVDAYYGNIQVKAIVSGGRLSDVKFLQYPNDRNTSIRINTEAMPILRSEAISAQSANVDIVSGASDSSRAFNESLASVLLQAKL